MNRYHVTYEVDGPDIPKIAHEIAIGQSIGNPNIRSEIENSDNISDNSDSVNIDEYDVKQMNVPTCPICLREFRTLYLWE